MRQTANLSTLTNAELLQMSWLRPQHDLSEFEVELITRLQAREDDLAAEEAYAARPFPPRSRRTAG